LITNQHKKTDKENRDATNVRLGILVPLRPSHKPELLNTKTKRMLKYYWNTEIVKKVLGSKTPTAERTNLF